MIQWMPAGIQQYAEGVKTVCIPAQIQKKTIDLSIFFLNSSVGGAEKLKIIMQIYLVKLIYLFIYLFNYLSI